jgi:DNA-directed RNA polymerase specialized sigma24 family protein
MSPLVALRASLVAAARRYSRVAHEVEDLAHDVAVSALRRGLPLEDETFVRSAEAAARRHGAFLARSAARRRAREARSDDERVDAASESTDVGAEGASLASLSPALRTTLLLLVLGLDKAELRHVLGLTDAALRKRFQALRAQAPLAKPELPSRSAVPDRVGLRRAQVGLLRRLVGLPGYSAGGVIPATAVETACRLLGASDPEGHGIFFAEVLTPTPCAATPPRSHPEAPRTAPRSSEREASC